ncbi:MAG: FhaA domain-containing protein, partial [Actinomycetota bacterium]
IVPNAFTVILSPRDHVAFEEIEDSLTAELVETIREYARGEGYQFLGEVTVTFTIDNAMRPGRFDVTSLMRESRGARGIGSLVLPSGGRVQLGPEPTSIGRLPDNTLPLGDSNVSRRHCEVRASGRGFVVVDVGSTNGTKVNGIRILGEHQLADGDILSVGSTHLRFEAS